MTSNVSSCYWKRLSGFGGSYTDTIASAIVDGNVIVEISSSDTGFFSDEDCGTWTQIDVGALSPVSSIGPGLWAVGSQVQPGTWMTSNVSFCYWKRLSGFDGSYGDTIESAIVDGNVIVEISSSDAGFSSNDDCGTWTRQN